MRIQEIYESIRLCRVALDRLPEVLRGYNISDEIVIMGSLDFVLGEVDR